MKSTLSSNEYPSPFLSKLKFHPSHTMEKSRAYERKAYSKLIQSLHLFIDEDRLLLTMNHITMPKGIPAAMDRTVIYESFINSILDVIFHEKKSKITSSAYLLNQLAGCDAETYASIEPISHENRVAHRNKSIKFQDEFAFRVWFKSDDQLISRVLLLILDCSENELSCPHREIQGFQRIFGNVDVFVIPFPVENSLSRPDLNFNHNDINSIQAFPPRFLIKIAHHLDHGQLLNLSELKQLGFPDLKHQSPPFSEDPYQQYLDDVEYYTRYAPNGSLMHKSLSASPFLLHQTPYKQQIIDSNDLRVSRAGCMGNMVYTTLLMGNEQNIIGGHAIGLYKRLYPEHTLAKDKFILLQVKHNNNRLTNWIEKLGRGRLFLEARNTMLLTNRHNQHTLLNTPSEKILSISPDVLYQYSRLYPLLIMMNLYASSIKRKIVRHEATSQPKRLVNISAAPVNPILFWYSSIYKIILTTTHLSLRFIDHLFSSPSITPKAFPQINKKKSLAEKTFTLVIKLMEQIAYPEGEEYHSVLNNIFFEIIKDYILLFQSDENSVKFRSYQSFNMDGQYAIFFELYPELKQDWVTGTFPIKIDIVLTILKTRKFLVSDEDEQVFKVFFLERLAYYVNVGCLEGNQKIPPIEQIKTFDDLANALPNLAGIIYNDLIKNKYKKTPFIEKYSEHLRACYDTSYEERNIDLMVKCGMSGTEEIGVRASAHTRFFDFDIAKKDNMIHQVATKQTLNLAITGVSNQNGFTNRFHNIK